jgi:hypothetical protein
MIRLASGIVRGVDGFGFEFGFKPLLCSDNRSEVAE